MDVPGVLQTIFNVDYVLTPIAADNFVMDSSFSFTSSVVRFLAGHSDVNRGVSVFISIQLFQLTSKASIVKPCAL